MSTPGNAKASVHGVHPHNKFHSIHKQGKLRECFSVFRGKCETKIIFMLSNLQIQNDLYCGHEARAYTFFMILSNRQCINNAVRRRIGRGRGQLPITTQFYALMGRAQVIMNHVYQAEIAPILPLIIQVRVQVFWTNPSFCHYLLPGLSYCVPLYFWEELSLDISTSGHVPLG